MANSRKDSRGYVLRTGESERKDGRYSYSYTDLERNRRTVYAKTLVELRKIERKIIRDKEDGLDPQLADRMTLNQLYDKYIEQKYDLKQSTRVNYLYMYNHFVRPTFGKRLIGKIKYSDVKKFYYRIILDEEMKANTLDSIHTQLHPAFQMAVRDPVLFFIASAIGFTSGNENSMAIVWLCLGSSFLCLGSTHKKKENNTDDK